MRTITTQADFDEALAHDEPEVRVSANLTLTITQDTKITIQCVDSSQPRIEAWDSSQPRIVARGSSQPRIVAGDSSQPRIEAWDSSQPRIEAWDSSQPRIVARGSSQPRIVAGDSSQPRIEAWDSSQISTAGRVAIRAHGPRVTIAAEQIDQITGTPAHVIHRQPLRTSEAWCEAYELTPVDGIVVLYKAVGEDYRSAHGVAYTPGSTPTASDWDGGRAECGGGLHFSPRPSFAREFFREAPRFVACPVRLTDIRPPDARDVYPQKVKAAGCAGPVREVTIEGDPLP